ncbi:hypothetical protein ACLB1M_17155 [Escherichia coli]
MLKAQQLGITPEQMIRNE